MFKYLVDNGTKPQDIGIYKKNIIPTNNFSDVVEINGIKYPNEQELWMNNKYSIFWSDFYQDFIVYENLIVMPNKYDDLEIQNYDIILTISKENKNILLKIISNDGYCFDFNDVLGIDTKFNIYCEDLKKYSLKKDNCYQCVISRKGLKSIHNNKKGNFVIKILQEAFDTFTMLRTTS